METVEWARSLTEELLADADPRRWRHVQGVAAQAQTVQSLAGDDADLLVAAAWLHDVGYAPALLDTGFHPLDGARALRRLHADDRLTSLVAHHSCALLEAEMRGLAASLCGEFDREEGVVSDALWYSDLTTGPDGQLLTAEQRIAEVEQRYGPDHLVTAFIRQARPELIAAVRRTEAALASQPQPR